MPRYLSAPERETVILLSDADDVMTVATHSGDSSRDLSETRSP